MRGISKTSIERIRGGRVTARSGGLGRYAVVIAAVASAAGCADNAGNQEPVSLGHALYQTNCVACHGEDARGGGPLARTLPVQPPSILEHLGHHTHNELVRIIRGGIPPAMPPTPLSEDEIGQIVNYVWTLVPESEVAELRAMQQHMEMMGDAADPNMPPPPAMDHSQHMQDTMPEMDHSEHMPGTTSMTTGEGEAILAASGAPAGAGGAMEANDSAPRAAATSGRGSPEAKRSPSTLASRTHSPTETER